MPERTLLIDGMYLVFSSFFAHRGMSTIKGEPTGAVYGFVTRIESLIQELKPQRIAVAFDSKEKNFRDQLYPDYKAKRQLPPEDLISQLPLIKEYLEAKEIRWFECPGFEADDIIAHLARINSAVDEVLIFSADKDLFQLIGGNVFVFHPKLKQRLDREGLKEHFGVYPEQVVDYLLLVGDASDNIPGVPGIGEKTATKLMELYGSVEAMQKKLDELDAKTADRIRQQQPNFSWTRRLLDFSQVPDIEGDFELPPFTPGASEKLIELFRRLSFHSMLKKAEAPKATPGASVLPIALHTVRDRGQLQLLRERIEKEGHCALDIETSGMDFFSADIIGISFSFADAGYYVPFTGPEEEAAAGFVSREAFVAEMRGVLQDAAVKKTGHNLKFDMLHLRPLGIHLAGIADDTMVISYLLFPNRRTHGLKELTAEYLHYRQTEYDELVGKGKEAVPLAQVPLEKISRYCIDDSYLALKLAALLKPDLGTRKLLSLYEKIEMPLLPVLAGMEYDGIKVDRGFLHRAEKILGERIRQCEEAVFQLAGYRFNLNSSQQLGELLFSKMGLPMGKKTKKTKAFSTDIDVLTELSGYPIVEKIIDYRTYKKLLSTYVEGLLSSLDPSDRIHTSFNQAVTATGRLSSSNPNLQNIPVGELGGVSIRRAFVAEKGWRLLSADYSQIELRVMAHFSGDAKLIEAFRRDEDIHRLTADLVFGDQVVQSESRRRAKIINFSIIYGSGAFSLSKELGVSVSDAKAFIEKYFATYGGVKSFIDGTIAAAEKDLEVRTLAGRVRPIPEIASQNRTVKENGNRMAVNTVIQGTAADIIKMAMLAVRRKMGRMRSRLLLQVHDELVFEYPPEEEKSLLAIVGAEMESASELRVPLKVMLKSGSNWDELDPVS